MPSANSITIVTRNVRLHEWVAVDAGLFEQAGLRPTMAVDSRMASVGSGDAPDLAIDGYDAINIGSASEWGAIKKANQSDIKLLSGFYGLVPFAVIVPENSSIRDPQDLRGKRLASVPHTGGYYAVLRQSIGQNGDAPFVFVATPRGQRNQAFRDGIVDAAIAFEPELSIALQSGFRVLAPYEVLHLNYFSSGMQDETVAAYLSVLKAADELICDEPDTWLRLWERSIPREGRGRYNLEKFSRGERLVFAPYTQISYERALKELVDWDVLSGSVATSLGQVSAADVG